MSELTEFRMVKDHFMQHDPESPLTGEQKPNFQGLNYYDERSDCRPSAIMGHVRGVENPRV